MQRLFVLWLMLLTLLGIAACTSADANPPPTITPTIIRANVAQATNVPTATRVLTNTPEPTATRTATPTITPTSTRTPTPTVTPTPLQTFTLNQCAEIWQPGIYKLARDIVAPGTRDCFYIQSHNVVFDCDNHLIEGNTKTIKDKQYAYSAFHVRQFNFPLLESPTNVEIRNCRARYFKIALYVSSGRNIAVRNNIFSDNLNTVDHNGFGIFLGMTEGGGIRFDDVQGGVIENNTTENQAIGIDVRNSDRIVIRNNQSAKNSAWGINLLNTSNSEVSANVLRDNVRYCKWGSG
ncbi:MAG: right-handed parallel beta-helix repeat-containing protein, partial [Anaerolineae bacterium]|nr:right-handed parallel beta-helix repeat-containing protein [Anaerolineae bacterium]